MSGKQAGYETVSDLKELKIPLARKLNTGKRTTGQEQEF